MVGEFEAGGEFWVCVETLLYLLCPGRLFLWIRGMYVFHPSVDLSYIRSSCSA